MHAHRSNKTTRNNRYLLRLPKVKLELARNGFFYSGAKIYNKLPLELRKDSSQFHVSLKNHKF